MSESNNLGKSRKNKSRCVAMQFIYSISLCPTENPQEAFQSFIDYTGLPNSCAKYAEFLSLGLLQNLDDINDIISRNLENWKIGRIAKVEMAILQLAVFEMIYGENVPFKVILNEMVECAKEYGSAESGSFVNGILDSIYHHSLSLDLVSA